MQHIYFVIEIVLMRSDPVHEKIYLASPHMSGLEQKYIEEAFKTNWIAPIGPNVDAFEKEVAEYVGIKSGAALTSGTSAIHMALRYLGIGRGDIVFCSSLTFSGSCNPVIYEGAEPVFIDSEPETWNMSPIALLKAFNESEKYGKLPRAVIIVDLYGQSADFDVLREICDSYNVPIIEDAAEALGATYKGRYCGTFGEIGVYSFNGNKIITTSGGGMLVSDNEDAVKKVRFWSTQAKDKTRHYEHSELGFNYRMSNILAGIGRGQLKVLGDRIDKKKHIYETYKNYLSECKDIEFMPVAGYGQPNYWLTVMTLKDCCSVKPIDIMLALEKENIESRPAWKPMHLQPYYENCRFFSHDSESISVSEDIFNRGVCLPSDTKMTDEDLMRVIGIIRGLFI